MALKVTYEHKDFPPGTEFGVIGLGTFKNGEARELTEEEEHAFIANNGVTVREAFGDHPSYKVSGTAEVKGKSVAEARPAQTQKGGES